MFVLLIYTTILYISSSWPQNEIFGFHNILLPYFKGNVTLLRLTQRGYICKYVSTFIQYVRDAVLFHKQICQIGTFSLVM